MKTEKITLFTQKTGRVFTVGDKQHADFIWIVCHGYGHLANYFIEKFSALDNGKNFIVCPEGLHRFYTKGFSGRVGASWMTKEDRESDITDYVNWLNVVCDNIIPCDYKGKIVLLGFSQGGATVCRWLERSGKRLDHLVLYASAFPPDVVPSGSFSRYLDGKIVYALGSDDEFINAEEKEKQLLLLKQSEKNIIEMNFRGSHEVYPEVLQQIESELRK